MKQEIYTEANKRPGVEILAVPLWKLKAYFPSDSVSQEGMDVFFNIWARNVGSLC